MHYKSLPAGVANHKAATGRANQKQVQPTFSANHRQASAMTPGQPRQDSDANNPKTETSLMGDKEVQGAHARYKNQGCNTNLNKLSNEHRIEKLSNEKVSEEKAKFFRRCVKVDSKQASPSRLKGQPPKALPKKRVYEEFDSTSENKKIPVITQNSAKKVKVNTLDVEDADLEKSKQFPQVLPEKFDATKEKLAPSSFVPVEAATTNGSGSSSGSGSPMEEASSTTSSGGMVTSGHLRSLFDGLSHLYLTSPADNRGCKRSTSDGKESAVGSSAQVAGSSTQNTASTFLFPPASHYQQLLSETADSIVNKNVNQEVKTALTAEFIASTVGASQNIEKVAKKKHPLVKSACTKSETKTMECSPSVHEVKDIKDRNISKEDGETVEHKCKQSMSCEASNQQDQDTTHTHHHHCRRHHKHHKHRHHHRRRKGKHLCCTQRYI